MSVLRLQLALSDGSFGRVALDLPLRPARGRWSWPQRLQSLWFSAPAAEGPQIASLDDHRDIAASLQGDGDAYARLVDRYQQAVAGWMWRFTRDRGQWEILVQDVLVEAYTSLAGYRGKGSFEGWLRTIATRVGYRFWKQRARRAEREPFALQDWDDVACRDADDIAADDASRLVHQLLAQLPPRDRLVLTLYYLDSCSVDQIAAQLNWTRGMVKVQMHRARKKLRRLLDEHESPQEEDARQ